MEPGPSRSGLERPRTSPERPKSGPKRPESAPRASKIVPRASKIAPRASKRRPRGAQETPRGAQEAPKRPQEVPKVSRKGPKSRPNGEEIVFRMNRVFNSVYETHFCSFLLKFPMLETLKIMLPCRRELNFQNIALLAVSIDFFSFQVISGPRNGPKNC